MDIKKWVERQNNHNRKTRILDGENYQVEYGGDGISLIIEVPPTTESGDGTTIYAGKITGAPTGGLYPVNLYDEVNGTLKGTGSAIPVMLHVGETLAVDTWIVVAESTVTGLTLV